MMVTSSETATIVPVARVSFRKSGIGVEVVQEKKMRRRIAMRVTPEILVSSVVLSNPDVGVFFWRDHPCRVLPIQCAC